MTEAMNSRGSAVFGGLFYVVISAFCAVVLVFIFKVYSGSIYHHFNNGGYLLDSGWFAFLFASADPWLSNPQSIHTDTFYQHHISPIIALWGLVTGGVLQIESVQSYALYTAACGVLIFLPFALLGLDSRQTRIAGLVIVASGGLFALSNEFIFRALGYPHYELAFVGACGTLFLALNVRSIWFAVLLATGIILVREDGGFFVAYIGLCCLAANSSNPGDRSNPLLWILVVSGVLLSCAALIIKVVYFPGFGTIRSNFIGDNYSHLTLGLVLDRLRDVALSAGVLPLILLLPVIVIRHPKTIFPILFISPLLLLQITSVRDVIGNFELHYSIPLAIMLIVILVQMIVLLPNSSRRFVDMALIFLVIAVTSAPLANLMNLSQNSGLYFNQFVFGPWQERTYLQDQVVIKEFLVQENGAICGSTAIVSLEPDLFSLEHSIADKLKEGCDLYLIHERDHFVRQLIPLLDSTGFVLIKSKFNVQHYGRNQL